MNFIKKWYIYQKERFPVMAYGFYILCIVIGTFYISNKICQNLYENWITTVFQNSPNSHLMGALMPYTINWQIIIPMFVVAFLQFLMVRIIDEFKDYEEDCKYRPYRPVPRGLVSLKELRVLFCICASLQFIITWCVSPSIIWYLIAVWVFFGVMSKSFFIKKFLEKHILIEVLLDELLMPILVLYLSKFVQYGNIIQYSSMQSIFDINILNIGMFLAMSYIISWIIEIARKVRCKQDEERGVKTYTAVLGIKKTILILFILETILMANLVFILGTKLLLPIASVYLLVNIINFLFLIKQNKVFAKATELSANIYVLISYLILGFLIL